MSLKKSKPQRRHIKLSSFKVEKVQQYLDDLGWEYDRMTSSGQETLDKLYKEFGMMTNAEADWLISKVEDM